MQGWKRWIAGGFAVLGGSSAFVWGVHSTQPELPHRKNASQLKETQPIDLSAEVDAFLSGSVAPHPVVDVHANDPSGLAAFSTWAWRVGELEMLHESRQLTVNDAFRLREVLGKQAEWSDAGLRAAVERPLSGALASKKEAVRLSRAGCNALRASFIEETRRAAPWAAALGEISEIIEALGRETSEEHLRLLGDLRLALPKLTETTKGARSFTAELDGVLATESFRELSRLVANSPLLRESCSLDKESLEAQFFLTDGAASAILVETERGLSPTEELTEANEVVEAFLDLELFAAPGPAECTLNGEAPFEWQPQGLAEASKALHLLPRQTLKALTRMQTSGRGSLMDRVTKALPHAACQKLTQLVCSHLKHGRLTQPEPSGIAALRRRATSLTLASSALRELTEEAEALGCSLGFGLRDAEQYARSLVVEGEALARGSIGAIRSRLEQFSSSDYPTAPRERALDQLRLQRLEVGAAALGIVEPGLRFLEQSGAELSPAERRWQVALADIDRGKPVHAADRADSGLFAFERLLGMFFLRSEEMCELAASSSVSALMGERPGVFYEFGRDLLAAIGERCNEKGNG